MMLFKYIQGLWTSGERGRSMDCLATEYELSSFGGNRIMVLYVKYIFRHPKNTRNVV